MVLLAMLLLLQPGYALISVTTVKLGDAATFTCLFHETQYSNTRVKWYKQSPGDTLTLMATLMKAALSPKFEEGFHSSRFSITHNETESSLTISDTVQADEAVYHCAATTWSRDQWSGSYLGFKGNSEKTSDYSIVQTPTVSGPVRPGDSVTLQCSLLSASDNQTCPGGHSVYWFRAGSDQSPPGVVSTDGSSKCEQRPDSVKSCVYRFSKTLGSSDAGTYHCAVATCGHILFGSGTKLEIQAARLRGDHFVLLLVVTILAVTLVTAAVLLYAIRDNKCDGWTDSVSLQENVLQRHLKRHEDAGIYSAAVFTVLKTGAMEAKAVERERIYAAARP